MSIDACDLRFYRASFPYPTSPSACSAISAAFVYKTEKVKDTLNTTLRAR